MNKKNLLKLRIYAITMRLKELETEARQRQAQKIVLLGHSVALSIKDLDSIGKIGDVMTFSEVKTYDDEFYKPSSIPNKHRKKRPFHD